MVPNKKGNLTAASKFKEKICANDLITKAHLQQFHPNYQKWLNDRGIKCTVHSGVTGGKNRKVEELKEKTRKLELEKERALVKSLMREKSFVNTKLEQALIKENQMDKKPLEESFGWDKEHLWDYSERTNPWEIEKEF